MLNLEINYKSLNIQASKKTDTFLTIFLTI